MARAGRRYRYVGPADVRASVADSPEGWPIRSSVDLDTYLAAADPRDRDEPFTYVIVPGGTLRLAPRRSEHVACAGGGEVLGAGEIAFAGERDGSVVTEVSNQSTGYRDAGQCSARQGGGEGPRGRAARPERAVDLTPHRPW
ncbi:hypothetical protein [Micromonospora sp. DT47]|uniref:hypothetical protein n=1 Tax=Micromonospora sp. DT47 TaxID=3393431 RepID=UPI003CF57CAB